MRMLLFLTLFLSFSFKWKDKGMNDPTYFNLQTLDYKNLSKSASLSFVPVTSTHWLHQAGGIARRYQSKNPTEYNILSKEEVFKSSDLSMLSPAEKYDLLLGNYDFPLTKQERVSMKNYKNPWEGHCHGWGVVSLSYDIPNEAVTLKNSDGLKIIFEPQDVIAILSYFEGMKQTPWDYWVIDHKLPSYLDKYKDHIDKNRVNEMLNSLQSKALRAKLVKTKDLRAKLIEETKKYKLDFYSPYVGVINKQMSHQDNDPNPAAMHLVLTNTIGHKDKSKRRGLIADTDPFKPVWNRPLFGYAYKELSSQKKGEMTYKKIEMSVSFIKELTDPKAGSIDRKAAISKKIMNYTLVLNKTGEIIGGTWAKGSDRFDFFWSPFYNQNARLSTDKFYQKKWLKLLARKMH